MLGATFKGGTPLVQALTNSVHAHPAAMKQFLTDPNTSKLFLKNSQLPSLDPDHFLPC